jgi:hypothetical protein
MFPIDETQKNYRCPMHGDIVPIYPKDISAAIPVCPTCGCTIVVIYTYGLRDNKDK